MKKGFVFSLIVFSFLMGFILLALSLSERRLGVGYMGGEKISYMFDAISSNIEGVLGIGVIVGDDNVTIIDELKKGELDWEEGYETYKELVEEEALRENVLLQFDAVLPDKLVVEPYGVIYWWDNVNRNHLKINGNDNVTSYDMRIEIEGNVTGVEWNLTEGNLTVSIEVVGGNGSWSVSDEMVRHQKSKLRVETTNGSFEIDIGKVDGYGSSIHIKPGGIGMDVQTTIGFLGEEDIGVGEFWVSAEDLATGLKRNDSLSIMGRG